MLKTLFDGFFSGLTGAWNSHQRDEMTIALAASDWIRPVVHFGPTLWSSYVMVSGNCTLPVLISLNGMKEKMERLIMFVSHHC